MEDYSLLSIVKVLHKWRKYIVYGTAGVAVLAVIVSLLVPVYYETTTTFYAASEDLFKPKTAFGYGDSEVDFYGTSEDIQRVLTVSRSNEVIDYLVDSFDHTHTGDVHVFSLMLFEQQQQKIKNKNTHTQRHLLQERRKY